MPDATITPPNTTRPSQPTSQSGAAAYIQQHKGVVIGGALAVAVLAFFLLRKKSTASSSSSTTTPQMTTTEPYSTGVTGDTNEGDYYAGILNAIQSGDTALSTAITGLSTAQASATNANTSTTNPATGATNNGSASGVTVGNDTYYPVEAGDTFMKGTETYYEPIPGAGIFNPIAAPNSGYSNQQQYVLANPSQPGGFQLG